MRSAEGAGRGVPFRASPFGFPSGFGYETRAMSHLRLRRAAERSRLKVSRDDVRLKARVASVTRAELKSHFRLFDSGDRTARARAAALTELFDV